MLFSRESWGWTLTIRLGFGLYFGFTRVYR